MSRMFESATSFNQSPAARDTSNVKSMFFMFENAKSFNQPIVGWDLSSLVNHIGILLNTKEFQQAIPNDWNCNYAFG